MKKLVILTALIPLLALVSCDKGDMEIKKMNRGDGTWTIESLRHEYYNSNGSDIDSTKTVDNPGELIFFKEGTLNELFDEHFVVIDLFDAAGNVSAYPGGAYYDDVRCKISSDAGTPIDGVWTILDNGRRKQEWQIVTPAGNGGLVERITLTLKKK